MKEEELSERITYTKIKDITIEANPKLIELTIPVYRLTPKEAQELNKKGFALKWIHKIEHRNGEPKWRLYQLIGRWG